jgi:hypothetical protein
VLPHALQRRDDLVVREPVELPRRSARRARTTSGPRTGARRSRPRPLEQVLAEIHAHFDRAVRYTQLDLRVIVQAARRRSVTPAASRT